MIGITALMGSALLFRQLDFGRDCRMGHGGGLHSAGGTRDEGEEAAQGAGWEASRMKGGPQEEDLPF